MHPAHGGHPDSGAEPARGTAPVQARRGEHSPPQRARSGRGCHPASGANDGRQPLRCSHARSTTSGHLLRDAIAHTGGWIEHLPLPGSSGPETRDGSPLLFWGRWSRAPAHSDASLFLSRLPSRVLLPTTVESSSATVLPHIRSRLTTGVEWPLCDIRPPTRVGSGRRRRARPGSQTPS